MFVCELPAVTSVCEDVGGTPSAGALHSVDRALPVVGVDRHGSVLCAGDPFDVLGPVVLVRNHRPGALEIGPHISQTYAACIPEETDRVRSEDLLNVVEVVSVRRGKYFSSTVAAAVVGKPSRS